MVGNLQLQGEKYVLVIGLQFLELLAVARRNQLEKRFCTKIRLLIALVKIRLPWSPEVCMEEIDLCQKTCKVIREQ